MPPQRAMLLGGYLEMRMNAWAESGARRGLRYAYPLLDRKLLEFALCLPPEAYFRDNQNRWLIRQLLQRYAPEPVVMNRSKLEPTRSLAMVRAIEQARPRLAAALKEPLKRRDMVDVERLYDDLTTQAVKPRGEKSPQFGRRRAALEMLDIDPRP